jgi:hypothetical protein
MGLRSPRKMLARRHKISMVRAIPAHGTEPPDGSAARCMTD